MKGMNARFNHSYKEHDVSDEICCLAALPVTHRKMRSQTGNISKQSKKDEKV